MAASPDNDQESPPLPPSQVRARKLVEELAESGPEHERPPEAQQAQAFLQSVWQGKAISRIPGIRTPAPDPEDRNAADE